MKALIGLKTGWENEPGLQMEVEDLIRQFGLKITINKAHKPSKEFCEKFYSAHSAKFFFKEIVENMCSGYNIFFVVEGEPDVISKVREIVKIIRARYGKSAKDVKNKIHGSGSIEDADREVALVENLFSRVLG